MGARQRLYRPGVRVLGHVCAICTGSCARRRSVMMAKRRSNSSGGGAVVFGTLILIGLVIKYYWWFIAAAVVVGLFFAVRALVRHARERKAVAAREAEELAYRADRQHRWARRGDSRGVYGVDGAELMRTISPEFPPLPTDASAEAPEIAAVVDTSEELTRLLAEKTPGWR